MNQRTRSLLLIPVGLALLLPAAFGQDAKAKPEQFSGIAIGTGGPLGGKSIGFDLRIKEYTSDSDVLKYAGLLKEGGSDALRRALEKLDVGQINPTGKVGNQIAIARKRMEGTQTVITVVTARIMPFIELYRSGRTTDYEFGFMQIRLNEKGEGEGNIMAAAKIRFDKKKDTYEIESYGNQYIKAINIRRQN